METFLEWLNQRDPEYLFESAFAEQNSELIEETFGRHRGRRPVFAPRRTAQVFPRRRTYVPVNRNYTQGRTQGYVQANKAIPKMDPNTGAIIPDQDATLKEPQKLDLVSLMGSNISIQEKQNIIKKFIADELQGDLRNANEDEIYVIASGINDGILDNDIMPYQLASELMNSVSSMSVKEELEKLTKTPLQRQLGNLINRADMAGKQFPPSANQDSMPENVKNSDIIKMLDIQDSSERNETLKSYVAQKGGIDRLDNKDIFYLSFGINQNKFDKNLLTPQQASELLKRQDLWDSAKDQLSKIAPVAPPSAPRMGEK